MHLRRWICAGLGLVLAGPTIVVAQQGDAANAQKTFTPALVSPAESLTAILNNDEQEFVSAAEAMPADKYDFAPAESMGNFKGVRTFGQQVKHVTEANYMLLHGFGIPGGMDRKTIEALTTKDDIVKALKASFAYYHTAVNTITPENAFLSLPGPPQMKFTRVSLIMYGLTHLMDHYGQLIEYLRMNGMVPPASQPSPNEPRRTGNSGR